MPLLAFIPQSLYMGLNNVLRNSERFRAAHYTKART